MTCSLGLRKVNLQFALKPKQTFSQFVAGRCLVECWGRGKITKTSLNKNCQKSLHVIKGRQMNPTLIFSQENTDFYITVTDPPPSLIGILILAAYLPSLQAVWLGARLFRTFGKQECFISVKSIKNWRFGNFLYRKLDFFINPSQLGRVSQGFDNIKMVLVKEKRRKKPGFNEELRYMFRHFPKINVLSACGVGVVKY